ncbi:MAG: benzoyl-CoA 2,3-epoxidase subunit BoxB, partial [Myxococcota bacterium]
GEYAGHHFDPSGRLIDAATFEAHRNEWLTTDADRAYLAEIQQLVTEYGKVANWLAPPRTGIKGHPVDFEYVRL